MPTQLTLVQPLTLASVEQPMTVVHAEMAALTPQQLIPLNIDVASTLCTVLGVLPKLRAMRARIVTELPHFDLAAFDRLELYVQALTDAHGHYLTAIEPPDHLRELAERGAELRARLLADAQSLALRDLLPPAAVAHFKNPPGFIALATDLLSLSILFDTNWRNLEGHCPTPFADIAHADRLAADLLRCVGARQHPKAVAAAAQQRQRAFTLLIRTYDDARRAVTYLCGRATDPNKIAPSLYGGRKRRKRAPAAL